jgi:hypothetical protein
MLILLNKGAICVTPIQWIHTLTLTAAQGHIAKSSSMRFVDTALVALLCHHDQPLFLVNMTSAGE